MASRKGCILFDLDGTLIDSRLDLADAVNLTRRHFGLEPIAIETVVSHLGDGARVLMERCFAEAESLVDKAVPLYKAYYHERMLDKTSLYPGVAEALPVLHANGWKLGVVTNKPAEHCREILRHFGLDVFFAEIVGGGDEFPLKPDPSSAMYILERTASKPEKSWMVGDNHTDMATGRRAGMRRCFARYGFGQLLVESFDIEISFFPELLTKL